MHFRTTARGLLYYNMTPEGVQIAARWVLLVIVLGCWLRKTGPPCSTSERAFLFILGPHRLEMLWDCYLSVGRGWGCFVFFLSFSTNSEETQGLQEMATLCGRTVGGWRDAGNEQSTNTVPAQQVQLIEHPQGSQAVWVGGVQMWGAAQEDAGGGQSKRRSCECSWHRAVPTSH